jgi:transcriptional regulator with XRE-family HTH domain
LKKDSGINQRIGEVRKALGITQQKFADDLRISRSHISAMELDTRKIPERLIRLISFTYGVREGWLKTGRGTMFTEGQDYRLGEVVRNFKRLDDLLQDYVLKQVQLALEYQENSKNRK